MDKVTITTVIAMAVICGLMFIMAAVTRFRPPRQINWLYGYRTARSMRTPATWHAANQYFALYFWRLSCLLPVVAVVAFGLIGSEKAITALLVVLIGGLLLGLWRTEHYLRQLFDDAGQPRT